MSVVFSQLACTRGGSNPRPDQDVGVEHEIPWVAQLFFHESGERDVASDDRLIETGNWI